MKSNPVLNLHLGCGIDVLEGYVNIDNLDDFGGVASDYQGAVRAEGVRPEFDYNTAVKSGLLVVEDAHQFLKGLPNESVDEIRSDRFLGRNYFKKGGWEQDGDEDWDLIAGVLKPNRNVYVYNAIVSYIDVGRLIKLFQEVHIEAAAREDGDTHVHITCFK